MYVYVVCIGWFDPTGNTVYLHTKSASQHVYVVLYNMYVTVERGFVFSLANRGGYKGLEAEI